MFGSVCWGGNISKLDRWRLEKTVKKKNLYNFALEIDEILTHKRLKRTLFIRTKPQSANFGGNPLYQVTQ